MADIAGQVWLVLPYVRGAGGLPILVISHLTRAMSYAPAFSTFRNDTSSTGPDTGGTQERGSSCVQVGAGARLTAARERHQYLGGEGRGRKQRPKASESLGRQYRVAARFLGYKLWPVLIRGFAQQDLASLLTLVSSQAVHGSLKWPSNTEEQLQPSFK